MSRLLVIVEGQTEETFVRDVLGPHLTHCGVGVWAERVLSGRKRGRTYKGGLSEYAKVAEQIQRRMKEDANPDIHFTTMFDLYALPPDFPGFDEARKCADPHERVRLLEKCLAEDVGDRRFIPYIQLHEFEALLFTDVSKFHVQFPGRTEAVENLRAVADEFPTPEHIDDDPMTAPSKRIEREFPGYPKVTAGPIIAEAIGLDAIRSKCRHFDEWLTTLEGLSQQEDMAGDTP